MIIFTVVIDCMCGSPRGGGGGRLRITSGRGRFAKVQIWPARLAVIRLFHIQKVTVLMGFQVTICSMTVKELP